MSREKERIRKTKTNRGKTQIQNKIEIKRGEQHTVSKTKFSIDNQQEYNRSTEVTALPPSFLIGIKTKSCPWHTSTLGTMKMKLGSGKEPQPSRILYIGPSKMLNDYYTPRA
jgi:hypothetical protein